MTAQGAGSSAGPTTFSPRQDHPRYCATCGAGTGLHHPVTRTCPSGWRPGDEATAMRELAAAQAAGDPGRIFVARGEAQRLHGQRHAEGKCATCTLLEATT